VRPLAISVVQVPDYSRRVEQNDEMLSEKSQSADPELRVGEPHGSRLGDSEHGAHDAHIDIVQFGRLSHAIERAVACDFGRRRADDVRVGKSRATSP
jgi:hypothetical protein